MFTRSHLQEMKRRYASMYAPPVEEKVIEDGTDEGAKKYKKDTPGQDIEKEFKEHCGVCGEQGIEEDEIEEGTALQVKMALDDAGLKGKWKNNRVYVKKRDVKKAEKALKGNVIYRGKPPVVVGEEVEIDEGLKDGQMVTLAQDPTVTGEYLMIPPAKAFPKTASDSIVGFKDKSLKKGKKVRVKIHNRKTYIELPKKVSVFVQVKDWEKNFQEEVEIDEAKGTAYPATIDTLRKIVKDKQHQTVIFDKGQALVDTFTASAMLAVYDAMKKPDIKKKFENMIKSKEGFIKTQAFAMKMIK